MPWFTDTASAISLVSDGDVLALGGMNLYRRPVALAAELIRAGRRGLTLLAYTAGFESDLLVGAGAIDEIRSCYFGLEIFGLAPMYTTLSRQGRVRVVDETEATLSGGLRAALCGLPALPLPELCATDLPEARPDLPRLVLPGDPMPRLSALPLCPDVALLHGLEADSEGNVLFLGNRAVDVEIARLARATIASVERVLPGPFDRIPVQGVILPAGDLQAIVEEPRGAWPTSCYPEYRLDGWEILEYVEACKRGAFEEYLREFVGGGRSAFSVSSALSAAAPPAGSAPSAPSGSSVLRAPSASLAPPTSAEVMVGAIARFMTDGAFVAQGIATPLVAAAAMLARLTHGPGITFGFAVGGATGRCPVPVSITRYEGDILDRAERHFGFFEVALELLPTRPFTEFFRPAQVDALGNFNNVLLGEWDAPGFRLPGPGGTTEVSCYGNGVHLYVPRHEPRVFVERVDFKSGAGFSEGGGRPPGASGSGPRAIVTDLAVLGFNAGRLALTSVHPGVTVEQVVQATGCSLAIPEEVPETPLLPEEHLRLLREEIDPLGVRDLELLSGAPRLERLRAILALEGAL